MPWPAAHSGAFAPRSRGMGGDWSRDHPQKGSSTSDNPSVTASRDSSLCTREPLRTGDADCRVASLLAMTVLNLCHSEEAQRADVGIRLFYDGRWTGVRAAESSAPTEGLPKSRQRADVGIGPYGKPDQPPKPAAHSGAFAPRTRGMGGNRRKDHPKRGTAPRPPGQRLAKRKARKEQLVKFGLRPIPSKCSTAYRVRKSQQSPARAPAGAASTEQNGLGPHPAAREGAPRP